MYVLGENEVLGLYDQQSFQIKYRYDIRIHISSRKVVNRRTINCHTHTHTVVKLIDSSLRQSKSEKSSSKCMAPASVLLYGFSMRRCRYNRSTTPNIDRPVTRNRVGLKRRQKKKKKHLRVIRRCYSYRYREICCSNCVS